MKIKNILSALVLLTVYSSVFGQEQQPKTVKGISIRDICFQGGFYGEYNPNGTLSDFNKLAPQSAFLKNNLIDFNPLGNYYLKSNIMFSVMLGIQFSDRKKTSYKANPLLRLGFSYFSGASLTNQIYKEYNKTYDTVTTQTGQTNYLDSIRTKSYGMNYSSQQLRFDGSIIFRTNPNARLSLYTGIGITAGYSICAKTGIYYYQVDRTETRSISGSISNNNDYSYLRESEKFSNKNNFGLSAYIPMGIDFRIGKKREFWKRTHLFFELRPGINSKSIPELRTFTNRSMHYGLGLKVSWD